MDHSFKVLRQMQHTKPGNDCLIADTVVEYEVHDIVVVEVFRRYYGWCDNGLDFRYRKEFKSGWDADRYFETFTDGVE